ncbi:hypothetical protein [Thiolapillus sp.]|uniref:hypothetical protein n=1 Tax=Thiolapillus sp. TaxID=2017437 RepID=UPI0025E943F5|nr:hypothetical protein [Thiolapillus sp.]
MTRTAGAQIGCQRLIRFWGLGCPKIYHEVEDTLEKNRNYGNLIESMIFLICSLLNPYSAKA